MILLRLCIILCFVEGFFCEKGTSIPEACPFGFYCPTGTYVVVIDQCILHFPSNQTQEPMLVFVIFFKMYKYVVCLSLRFRKFAAISLKHVTTSNQIYNRDRDISENWMEMPRTQMRCWLVARQLVRVNIFQILVLHPIKDRHIHERAHRTQKS